MEFNEEFATRMHVLKAAFDIVEEEKSAFAVPVSPEAALVAGAVSQLHTATRAYLERVEKNRAELETAMRLGAQTLLAKTVR